MADPFDKEQQALRDLYCNLMEEVKHRLDLILAVSTGKHSLPKLAACELCYLQFRLTCEVIALALLAAHGDITASRSGRLTKAYRADWIMNTLEKLHPDFYPQPSQQMPIVPGEIRKEEPIKSGFLTKTEFLALYHECDNLLHRGTMRKITDRRAGDLNRIRSLALKTIKLLNCHHIQLSDSKHEFWVIMVDKDDGKVHASIMQKMGGPAPLR